MRKAGVFYLFFVGMMQLNFCIVYAQNTVNPKPPLFLLSDIKNIQFTHPSQLPSLDCRLDALERVYYEALNAHGHTAEMSVLQDALNSKRQWIDVQRSYMDSLCYTLAVSFFDSNSTKRQEALVLVNKALQYNRFYTPSVLLKLKILQAEPDKDSILWIYLQKTLNEQYSKKDIRLQSQHIYNLFLFQLSILNAKGLYGDVLQKYEIFKTLLPIADRFLIIDKTMETNILKEAHQGVFRSYYNVSEKAFKQGHLALAEKYALRTHTYYTDNRTYMDELNPSLQILAKIINLYQKSAIYSDRDEKAYFTTRIEAIKSQTNIDAHLEKMAIFQEKIEEAVVEPLFTENTEPITDYIVETLVPTSSDAKAIQVSDEVKVSAEVPTTQETEVTQAIQATRAKEEEEEKLIPQIPNPIKQNQEKIPRKKQDASQQTLFDKLFTEATLALSVRQYGEALLLLQKAIDIQSKYSIHTATNMDKLLQSTAINTIEQLLNKAQYRLWVNQTESADSLCNKAEAIKNTYQPHTVARINQLFSSYQEQKQNIFCQKLKSEVQYLRSQAKSYANTLQYASAYNKITEAIQMTQQNTCELPIMELSNMQKEYKRIYMYFELKDSANVYLTKKDTISYITTYQNATKYFEQEGLDSLGIKNIPLFNKLTYEQNYSLLLAWAKNIVLNQSQTPNISNEIQLQEILAYLEIRKYNTSEYKHFRKLLRKSKLPIK